MRFKAFLSRQIDRARMAYGRITKEMARACVIVGTTNDSKFLTDITGNRRYWPVTVKRFDVDALRRDRDQLWAEAAHREAAGESIRLDPALYDAAAEVQSEHEVDNQFIEVLDRALGDVEGKIRSADCWDIVGVPATLHPGSPERPSPPDAPVQRVPRLVCGAVKRRAER